MPQVDPSGFFPRNFRHIISKSEIISWSYKTLQPLKVFVGLVCPVVSGITDSSGAYDRSTRCAEKWVPETYITLGTCQPIRLNLNSAWTKSIKPCTLTCYNKCGLERAYTPERQMCQSIIFVHQFRVYPHFRTLTDTNSHTFRKN